MKRKLAMLAAILLPFVAIGASYTNSFVRNGVTYVQRGGLTIKDYVVTNVTSSGSGGGITTNALSRAEAEAGFTEWTCVPAMAQGQYAISIVQSTGESGWRPSYADGEGTGDQKGDGSSTSLSWAADEWMGDVPLTATRVRLPTMADLAWISTSGTNYTDSAIAANNPAFVAAVTNCPVMIAAEDETTLGEFGKYGTLGALLAALAAAITWLKTNKADAASLPYALVDVTVTNGTAQLTDRAINRVEVASPIPENGLALAFPDATAGKVRDFLVRLTIPAGDAPQIAYPEGVTFENADGSFPEINTDESVAATTLLMFTETAPATGTGANATPARFLVKGEALKEVS